MTNPGDRDDMQLPSSDYMDFIEKHTAAHDAELAGSDISVEERIARQVYGRLHDAAQQRYFEEIYAPGIVIWRAAIRRVQEAIPDSFSADGAYLRVSKFFKKTVPVSGHLLEELTEVSVGTSAYVGPRNETRTFDSGLTIYDIQRAQNPDPNVPNVLAIDRSTSLQRLKERFQKRGEASAENITQKTLNNEVFKDPHIIDVNRYVRMLGDTAFTPLNPSEPTSSRMNECWYEPREQIFSYADRVSSSTTIEDYERWLKEPLVGPTNYEALQAAITGLDMQHPVDVRIENIRYTK